MVLIDLGELAEAKECSIEPLMIDENVYGPVHPSGSRDVNNLGMVLKELGELQGAESTWSGPKIDEQVYGGPSQCGH